MKTSRSRLGTAAICVLLFAGCEKPAAIDNHAESTQSPAVQAMQARTTIAVAAAADLKFALDEIAAEFQQQNPEYSINATYGASGTLFAQLSNQAPFDLFLSADASYPDKLIEQGLAVRESRFPYAVGHVVVWVRNDSLLDLEKLGMRALIDPSVKLISLANPKHAPYGRAAEAALKHFELDELVKDRLALAENVAQATQFVESGAADIGLIAQSLAVSPKLRDKGRYWVIPDDAYSRLEQVGVRLNGARSAAGCEKLAEYLQSAAGRVILERHGLHRP